MKVLALDLSSRTGFAVGGPDDPRPLTGVWRLPSIERTDTVGKAFAMLWQNIVAMVKLNDVGVLIYEAPLSTYAHTGYGRSKEQRSARKTTNLARGLIGLSVVAETCGEVLGLEVLDCDVQSVRKNFVGYGRPTDPKAVVMARCRQLGWPIEDDNAADAAAVWALEMASRYPSWSPNSTPLFARAAS